MKKWLKYTGITLLVLILAAFLIPVLFKDKIVALVKEQINANVMARVDFKDVSISLFRHFPKLSVGLEDISVVGVETFSRDTLLSARRLDASMDLISALRGKEMKIHGVFLQSPRIHAIRNAEGKANWDITRPDSSTASGSSSSFSMKLEKYAVQDGYLYYRDEQAGMQAEIDGLDHEGKGDFSQDVFTLSTSTQTRAASFSYGGIPYLVKAKTGVNTDIEISKGYTSYAFRQADIRVNELALRTDGVFTMVNDSTYDMDIRFDAPSNAFRDILSLVPAVYKKDFDAVKTSGTASLKGFVKGRYSAVQLPAYDIDLGIKDGFFQYPGLPQSVKDIQVAMKIANPDGVMDHSVVNISRGHLQMGNEPVDFRLLFRNPETEKYIDAFVKGKLDLASIGQFIKLEEGTKLAGLVQADAFAKGSMNALQQQKGVFTAGGFFRISGLYYASTALPQPLQHGNFHIALQNEGGIPDATTVDVQQGHFELASQPFDFQLKLDHPMTAVNFSGWAKGKINLQSMAALASMGKGSSMKGMIDANLQFKGSKADIDQKNFQKIQLAGNVTAHGVEYTSQDLPHGIVVETAALQFSPQQASLSNLVAHFEGTTLRGNGKLDHLIGYALNKEILTGAMNISADKVLLNKWMQTDTVASTSSSTQPFAVPAMVDLTVNANAVEVIYDKTTYSNVRGTLLVKDETVRLQNVQTEALGGTIALNGSYATKEDKSQPAITMNYDVKDVNIQQAFTAFNTVQKLIPIGQFLSGKMNSQFSMAGKLKPDMFPDLSSLTGNGNLLLLQGVLSRFQPMEQLANQLNVSQLKDVSLKDIKTYFEFANGKVLVKPFQVKVKDIDMQIGGMHGLDQSMDYLIGMKIPRSYLGNGGNTLVNNLASQSAAKGVPVNLGETVNLNIIMGGSIMKPSIKTDLKETAGDLSKELKQQAAGFVQAKADSAKATIRDSVKVVKDQLLKDAKDNLTKNLLGTKDSTGSKPSLEETKNKATQTLKNTFGNLFKKKQADTTRQQ